MEYITYSKEGKKDAYGLPKDKGRSSVLGTSPMVLDYLSFFFFSLVL